MKSVIFDLDMTLVDTTVCELARRDRKWNLVYELIPQCTLYEGMEDVFSLIRKFRIKACIVSTSPRPYIERLKEQFDIPCRWIVGYHDARPIKPHPAQMLKALEIMGEPASNVISFGDRATDIEASNAAGIESVACFWGTKERKELMRSGYKHAIIKTSEIPTLIR